MKRTLTTLFIILSATLAQGQFRTMGEIRRQAEREAERQALMVTKPVPPRGPMTVADYEDYKAELDEWNDLMAAQPLPPTGSVSKADLEAYGARMNEWKELMTSKPVLPTGFVSFGDRDAYSAKMDAWNERKHRFKTAWMDKYTPEELEQIRRTGHVKKTRRPAQIGIAALVERSEDAFVWGVFGGLIGAAVLTLWIMSALRRSARPALRTAGRWGLRAIAGILIARAIIIPLHLLTVAEPGMVVDWIDTIAKITLQITLFGVVGFLAGLIRGAIKGDWARDPAPRQAIDPSAIA